MSATVHINPLRWFAERDGGPEFVRTHGNVLPDAAIRDALATPYPEARQVVTALRIVRTTHLFTLSFDAPEPSPTPAVDTPTLGAVSLAVPGNRDLIPPQATVTGLTCTAPDDEAVILAARALADTVGPQVVWDDTLTDVMLVDPDSPLADIRARWRHPRGAAQ